MAETQILRRNSPRWLYNRSTLHSIAALSLVAAVITGGLAAGHRLNMQADAQYRAETELENQNFCRQVGQPVGSAGYGACAASLNVVRANHAVWLSRRNFDLL
jgi:hypothetical protein